MKSFKIKYNTIQLELSCLISHFFKLNWIQLFFKVKNCFIIKGDNNCFISTKKNKGDNDRSFKKNNKNY